MSKCYTIKPLDFDCESGYNYTGMYEEWTAKSPVGNFQIDEFNNFFLSESVGLDVVGLGSISSCLDWLSNFGWSNSVRIKIKKYFLILIQ